MFSLGKDLQHIHDNIFKMQWKLLEGPEKAKIKEQLRPHLGHPGNLDQLENLLEQENSRMEEVSTLVHEVHRQILNRLQDKQNEMLDKLAATSEYFLKAFDNIIVSTDAHPSDVYPIEQPRHEDPKYATAGQIGRAHV
mgnify:CR=1 FL=1